MRQHIARWLLGAALALALVYGLITSGGQPTVVHGAEPTSTPTEVQTNSGDPGSHGGGGGG